MGNVFIDSKCVKYRHSCDDSTRLSFHFNGHTIGWLSDPQTPAPEDYTGRHIYFDSEDDWVAAYKGLVGEAPHCMITSNRGLEVPNLIVTDRLNHDVVLEAFNLVGAFYTQEEARELIREQVFEEEKDWFPGDQFYYESVFREFAPDTNDSFTESDRDGRAFYEVVRAMTTEGWSFFEIRAIFNSWGDHRIDSVTQVVPSVGVSETRYLKDQVA